MRNELLDKMEALAEATFTFVTTKLASGYPVYSAMLKRDVESVRLPNSTTTTTDLYPTQHRVVETNPNNIEELKQASKPSRARMSSSDP